MIKIQAKISPSYIFRGKIKSLPTPKKSGTITIFYNKDLSGLLIDFDENENKTESSFDIDSEYQFNIISKKSQGLNGYKAINMKPRMNYDKDLIKKKQIFKSQLIEIDQKNKIGKLKMPQEIKQSLITTKTKKVNDEEYVWCFQNDLNKFEIVNDRNLINHFNTLKMGQSISYEAKHKHNNDSSLLDAFFGALLSNTSSYIATKLSDNPPMIERKNKFTNKKLIIQKKPLSLLTNNMNEYITFQFSQCKGFKAMELNIGCILQFNIGINRDYNDDADDNNNNSNQCKYRAINIRIPLLTYRWQKFDSMNKKWRALGLNESIELETLYNPKHQLIEDIIRTDKEEKIRRIIRFKGKILDIDKESKRGKVRINYSKQYGKNIGIWFNFRDCKFNPNLLKIGDDVEYNLNAYRAVNVKLWLINYKWMEKTKDGTNNDDDDNWTHCSYHQCIEYEEKYNNNNNNNLKIDIGSNYYDEQRHLKVEHFLIE